MKVSMEITVDEFSSKFSLVKNYLTWLPPSQYSVVERDKNGIICIRRHDKLFVIESRLKYSDGKEWTHVSMSYRNRVPSYETMCNVKSDFLGDLSKAIQVFAPIHEHVNIHKYCLHLYSTDQMPIPDFRIMGQI